MKNDFSKILLAYDGSEDSVNALKKAEHLAKRCEASLTVVYVDPDPFSQSQIIAPGQTITTFQQPYPILGATHASLNAPVTREQVEPDLTEKESDKILSDAKVRLSKALKEVTFEQLTGQPANEICSYAKENEIDLIVVGNSGISGIKKFVMGSVSDKVTHQSECPVLVVK